MKKIAASTSLIFALVLCFGIVLTLFFCFSPAGIAKADDTSATQYIYAAPSDLKNNNSAGKSLVPIRDLSKKGTPILFYLPESYYAGVIETDFYYEVNYMGMDKIIINFSDIDSTAVKSYSGVTADNAAPNKLLTTKNPITINFTEVSSADNWTIKFVGFVDDANIYVSAQKDDAAPIFGTASKSAFNDTTVEYHAIAKAEKAAMENPVPAPADGALEGDGKNSKALRIILIIGIAVPAVIIILLLFKPTKDGRNYDKQVMKRERRESRYDYDRDRSYNDRDRDRYPTNTSYDRRDDRRDDYQSERRSERDRYYDDRDRDYR